MQGKVLSGKFRQYGRRVSIRVSVKIRVRFRFIHVGDFDIAHAAMTCHVNVHVCATSRFF